MQHFYDGWVILSLNIVLQQGSSATLEVSKSSTFILQYDVILTNLLRYLSSCALKFVGLLAFFSLDLNFFIQFYCFILLLSEDVELNPGSVYEHVLDIIHLNIRSIRHKLDSLNTFLHDFDIACFTETHQNDSILDEELELDSFNSIYRKDRNSFGGGVMIYLLNAVRARRRVALNTISIMIYTSWNSGLVT